MRELGEEAERFGVIVGIEAGVNHPVYSPKTLERLLDEVASNNLQIIFDPVNLLTIDNYGDQEAIFQHAFELIGDRIAILHAKDFLVEEGELKTVAVVQGLLNYEAVFRMIKPRKPYIQILMESVKDPFITSSVTYLQCIYNEV
ncbi:sugar phosphate isomerase/epimerase family protein [Peribacillus deserti]|uniref:sugar phosphate isomerase/epimerase family protein n=1 Tax=Peribacillus deserti TaxID=673318 RepID=UPI001C60A2FB|nr:TIM barrel protein [Peribacillus deserti]